MKTFCLRIRDTNIGVQKIDGSKLDTFGILIACFLVEIKERRSCFFEETFLLANISIDITVEMIFLL